MQLETLEKIIKFFDCSNMVGSNSAVVFDIDGTLINNLGQPIHTVCKLYEYFLKRGVNIFLVTARYHGKDNAYRKATSDQLKGVGIFGYKNLYMRSDDSMTNYFLFKKECRKDIMMSGYNIILSIGDNAFDIGEYGGVGFIV